MDRIEKTIKEYSTKKLKEIVGQQSPSYSDNFINYVKDELVRRGEEFPLNEGFIKDVAKTSDEDLKKMVEQDYQTYHLEYIEIARQEYLRRGFKNKMEEWEEGEKPFEKRYPASRSVAGFISFIAWTVAIITAIIAFMEYAYFPGNTGLIMMLSTVIIGAVFFVILLSQAEMIKVFLDIEENTRKYSDYYKDWSIKTTTENKDN